MRALQPAPPPQSRIKELEIALEGLRQQQRESRRKTDAALKDVATARAELDSARTKLQQLQQVLCLFGTEQPPATRCSGGSSSLPACDRT